MGEYLYIPISDDEEEKDIDWNASSEILPTHTKAFVAYLSLLLISLIMNVLLLLHHFPKSCPAERGITT
jgi:hypothetical protein